MSHLELSYLPPFAATLGRACPAENFSAATASAGAPCKQHWRQRGPPSEHRNPTRASKLDPFKAVINEILIADLDAPHKQRHTVPRIFNRLRNKYGMTDVSYPLVRGYIARWRPEICVENGRADTAAFAPQPHLPGREAEVDFGEISVRLRGEAVTCHLLALRMSYSGKAVHRVSATGGQEAFFEGHVHAFKTLGGVPAGRIRYDNLKAAVAQVIGFSRQRVEAARWVAFRSHFDIDTFYCQPGVAGAHEKGGLEKGGLEKGGLEGDIGRFRRNHLVPIPGADSLRELNEFIGDCDRADDNRRIGHRAHTVGEAFSAERQLLKPLPLETFETGLWLTRASIASPRSPYAPTGPATAVYLHCIHELGYMTLAKRGAGLLFQVLTEREERASVAIASNEAFSGNMIETGADSYRLAQTLRDSQPLGK